MNRNEEARHPTALALHSRLLRVLDAEHADGFAFGMSLSESTTDEEKAAWVRHVTAALERELPADVIRSVMMGCHDDERCRLGEMKEWLGGLYRESSSLAEFVEKVNAHGAGWRLADGAVYTKYLWCECHMLGAVDSLPTATWCHCTEGYTKALFEHVLGCEVESELLQTLKTGHDCCVVKITPVQ